MAVNGCRFCLDKQRRIDELEEELKRLQAKLRYEERREEEGFFGSSTPSSKRPIKPNSEQKDKKPKGLRPGHKGVGRRSHEEGTADRTVEVGAESEICPGCGTALEKQGMGRAQCCGHTVSEARKDHISSCQALLSSLPP